jgi:hypothetical protein
VFIQPAQQFPRLAGRQFFNFFDSEFDCAHGMQFTDKLASGQAGNRLD